MKVKELLKDSTCWTKRAYARDKSGEPRSIHSEDTCRWCLIGAVHKLYPDTVHLISVRIYNETKMDAVVWNDDPKRTYEEVANLIDKLGI